MLDYQGLARAVQADIDQGLVNTPGESSSSAPTNKPGRYEDYVDQIKQLTSALMTGTPEQQVTAERSLAQIKEIVGKKDADSVDSLIAKTVMQGINFTGNKEVTTPQEKLIKNVVRTQLGLGLIKAGTGLAQILKSEAKKKGIEPPDMPDELYKNPQLAAQINRSMVLAEEGDTKAKAVFEDQLSQNRAYRTAMSKASGNVGQFLSNVQAGDRRDQRLIREFAGDQSRFRSEERGRLANLIAQSMREDQAIQSDQWRRFDVQNNAYQSNINALQQQRNSGFNNMFIGLEQIGSYLPMAFSTKRDGGLNVPTPTSAPIAQPMPETPIGQPTPKTPVSLSGFDGKPTSNNYLPRTINNATMLMLGNQAFRTPTNIQSFQDYATTQGYTGFSPGEWDMVTSQAYKDLMMKPF